MTWTLVHGDSRKVTLPTPKPGQRVIVCTDPPFSDKTHAGRRTGSSPGGYQKRGMGSKSHAGSGVVSEITYAPLDKTTVARITKRIVSLKPEWVVVFGDITGEGTGTIPWWGAALKKAGLYTFAPLPWCKSDAAPRKSGEGPDSAAEWIEAADGNAVLTSAMLRRIAQEIDTGVVPDNDRILIARHMKRIRRYGSRDGFFFEPTSSTRSAKGRKFQGEKPLGLMRQVLKQYAEPGDLVVDFFCGRGTTLVAAVEMDCDAWGVECDEETHAEARLRLEALSAQPALPGVSFTRPKQVVMPLTTSECPTSDYCERTDHSNC